MTNRLSRPGRPTESAGLPVAPSLLPTLEEAHVESKERLADRRTLVIGGLAIALGLLMGIVAELLARAIGLVTNLAYFGRWSSALVSPAGNSLGLFAIGVPVLGGLLVGLLAKFGSPAIRGHGIPEAMERILEHESRIPARLTWLKPLSAAIAIGTGGPFGAEGPIIATGGALGSLLGQKLRTSAHERKTLLAAGAAAGMSATFGSPFAAVLLAIELLLFELRPRSVVPVGLAAVAASGVRIMRFGAAPVFAMDAVEPAGLAALAGYAILGALVGGASVFVTHSVYSVEDQFERLPIHWAWWPALGGLAVGLVGLVVPKTLGVGYDNIEAAIGGRVVVAAVVSLGAAKFVSWVIALGSGTSGGTLAPLLTFGSGLGLALGTALARVFPHAGISPTLGALVGMAAMFAGASRAVFASAAFALETTHAPHALAPLLAGCVAAHLVSCLRMKHSIMTKKIERRGVRVPGEYAPDPIDGLACEDAMVEVEAGVEFTAAALSRGAPLSRAIARLARAPDVPVPLVATAGGPPVGMVTAGSVLAAVSSIREPLAPARSTRP